MNSETALGAKRPAFVNPEPLLRAIFNPVSQGLVDVSDDGPLVRRGVDRGVKSDVKVQWMGALYTYRDQRAVKALAQCCN